MIKYCRISKNIKKIKELFPNCVTEGKDKNGNITLKIDYETLKQELSNDIVSKDQEKYEFTWPGKRKSILLANQPTDKILVPCKEESVNWDATKNLYIEGDNLDVLKIIRKDYLNKVKMIYIDPPYNTGVTSRVYKDKFTHSDWLNMMYPRLKLARDLLTDDGVIFISIDDHEVHNLRKFCDEIFGEENFITIFAVENNPKGRKNNAFVSESYEHCLVYTKNKQYIKSKLVEKNLKKYFNGIQIGSDKRQVLKDKYGEFRQSKRQVCGANNSNALAMNSNSDRCFVIYYNKVKNKMELLDEYEEKKDQYITSERGKFLLLHGYTRYACSNLKTGRPSIPLYSRGKIYNLFFENSLYFKNDGTIYEKDREIKKQINSFIPNKKYGLDLMTESATSKMDKLFEVKGVFSNTKALDFIKILLELMFSNNFTILDFFSGSATTAHAVMQLNAEDGGNRKFIMVQLPEPCDEKSVAFKAGYKNICEIGKERIRRAGKKIIEETGKTDLDVGFRVLKLVNNVKNIL